MIDSIVGAVGAFMSTAQDTHTWRIVGIVCGVAVVAYLLVSALAPRGGR